MSTTLSPTPASQTPAPAAQRAAGARRKRRSMVTAVLFALPALVLLGALVGYPILYSVVRSTFDAQGSHFVGLSNYAELFQDHNTLIALRNTATWVLVVPALLTGIGLVLAVLTEKIRWATAFKLIIFMPMAVSFLAAGITFRLVYDEDPNQGILNAATVGVHDAFTGTPAYPGARPRDGKTLSTGKNGDYTAVHRAEPGSPVTLGLVGITPAKLPTDAEQAVAAPTTRTPDAVSGVVYLDFALGGGGKPDQVDKGEKGLPGVTVQLTREGRTVATATTGPDGTFRFPDKGSGPFGVTVPAKNFAQPYAGVSWLGEALITPAIMAAYLWVWAGFSMVLIGAGLAALPRETLEAARMDGANEWQVFRKITVPLLAPVLSVVFVTLIINVMKVFDLVYIIAPGPVQQDANVLALQMWLVSFGGGNNQGLGSAIGVVLLLLVIPAMAINIRRFRRSR
ncbi:ABC transporter permease subunit [Streptomyces montanus]|uniref:ABC transporter permease subunit n=1 Tax=Streptomyces montanus TaxID=2580423 RepID=A0A5R9FMH4_9ACTN|nr:ABC transporter permease subunit [Streptomyces montanus]TLS43150.1 ABC transporter permease subunit [Streptomyces montanus]